MQVTKQQLELDMEQQTGSKSEKVYIKAVGKPRGKATDPLIHAKGRVSLLLQHGPVPFSLSLLLVFPILSIGEGNGTPLQYSCLENPMDGGACWAAVHGVAESRARLSDFTFIFMHWRRKWQPTPVFFPGESQGWESLVGCRLWGRRVRHD